MGIGAKRIAAVKLCRSRLKFVALRIKDLFRHRVVEASPAVLHAGAQVSRRRPRAGTVVVRPQLAAAENAVGVLRGAVGRSILAVRGEEEERRLRVNEAVFLRGVHRRGDGVAGRSRPRGRHGTGGAALHCHVAERTVFRVHADVHPVAVHAGHRRVAELAGIIVAVFPAAPLVLVHDEVESLFFSAPRAEHYGIRVMLDVVERHFSLYADLAGHAGIDIEVRAGPHPIDEVVGRILRRRRGEQRRYCRAHRDCRRRDGGFPCQLSHTIVSFLLLPMRAVSLRLSVKLLLLYACCRTRENSKRTTTRCARTGEPPRWRLSQSMGTKTFVR